MQRNLNEGKKQIINGALLLTFSMLAVKIFGLIYKVPLSYILSDEGMGYFNTAYSVYAFFYVISTAGTPKAISILTASSDGESGERICIGAFRAFFFIGIIFTLIFIFISKPLAIAFGSTNSYLSMLSIAPSIAFVAASGALRGYFNGKLELVPVALSELIAGVSKLVFGLVFAYQGARLGFEIYEIASFSIFGISLGSFLGFVYLYLKIRLSRKKRERSRNIDIHSDFKTLRKIFKISIPLTLTTAVGSLINLFDVALVMRFLERVGYSELQANIIYGNYTTLAVPMFNLVATLLLPVTAVLLPLLCKNNVAGDERDFGAKTKISVDIALYISVPIAFLYFGFSDSILSFLFEDGSAKMAAPLLSSLSFAVVFMALLLVVNTAIEGSGNYRLPLVSLTAGSLVKLVLSAVLIPIADINIMAAPIGTIASYFVSFIISYVYLTKSKKIKLSIFKAAFFPVLFSALASFASMAFNSFFGMESWHFKQIITYMIYAFVYLILFFIYILALKNDKKLYNSDKNPPEKLYI